MEDAEHRLLCGIGFFVCDTRCNLHRSSKNGEARPHGAESVWIIGHMNSYEPRLYFLAIVPNFEGEVSGQHILPEFIRKSRTRLRVMGVWCSQEHELLNLCVLLVLHALLIC